MNKINIIYVTHNKNEALLFEEILEESKSDKLHITGQVVSGYSELQKMLDSPKRKTFILGSRLYDSERRTHLPSSVLAAGIVRRGGKVVILDGVLKEGHIGGVYYVPKAHDIHSKLIRIIEDLSEKESA